MESYKLSVQNGFKYLTGAAAYRIIMTMVLRDEVIKRVHRQHNSLVMVVPMVVRKLLDIRQGDYVYFSWPRGRKSVKFGKVHLRKEPANGRAKHTVRKNTGR